MMPPPLHLSDIRCKCFPCRRSHGASKSHCWRAQWTSGQIKVCVGWWKKLCNCLTNENKNLKIAL